jgi:acyl-CoA thioester hydrolase
LSDADGHPSGGRGLSLRIPLRSRDIDSLGHVNQAAYHEFLEEARVALIAETVAPELQQQMDFVLAHVELDYRREVLLEDGYVEVSSLVTAVGRSSVRIEHQVRLGDGAVAAEGHSVLVAWDVAERRSRAIPDDERRRLRGLGPRVP